MTVNIDLFLAGGTLDLEPRTTGRALSKNAPSKALNRDLIAPKNFKNRKSLMYFPGLNTESTTHPCKVATLDFSRKFFRAPLYFGNRPVAAMSDLQLE